MTSLFRKQATACRHTLRLMENRRDKQGIRQRNGIRVGDQGWGKLDEIVRLSFQSINGF